MLEKTQRGSYVLLRSPLLLENPLADLMAFENCWQSVFILCGYEAVVWQVKQYSCTNSPFLVSSTCERHVITQEALQM